MFQYLSAKASVLLANKKGQGMVEYALILAFVVVVAAVLIGNGGIQESVENIFNQLNGQLDTAANNASNAAGGGGSN